MKHPPIEDVRVSAYRIPTDTGESDGTFAWDATTIVIAHVAAGGVTGLGYTYGAAATVNVIADLLAPAVAGRSAFDIPAAWHAMNAALRNVGRPGIGTGAVAAVDVALWDLKAKLLDVPLVRLLGQIRDAVCLYGSGGFTSYTPERLAEQLGGWARGGLRRVKMKVGRDPAADVARVRTARAAIGDAELFVDANGAYTRKQALAMATAFAAYDVRWFEEPVSSDDLAGLRLLRDRAPPRMDIAAGEYGYDAMYFRRMLDAGAVDVLQADATRCGGITGFLQADVLCRAYGLPLSAHTAPALHLHVACAAPSVIHIEYFHDHVRVEEMLFDGVVRPAQGALAPDLSRPGLGLSLRVQQAERFALSEAA